MKSQAAVWEKTFCYGGFQIFRYLSSKRAQISAICKHFFFRCKVDHILQLCNYFVLLLEDTPSAAHNLKPYLPKDASVSAGFERQGWQREFKQNLMGL